MLAHVTRATRRMTKVLMNMHMNLWLLWLWTSAAPDATQQLRARVAQVLPADARVVSLQGAPALNRSSVVTEVVPLAVRLVGRVPMSVTVSTQGRLSKFQIVVEVEREHVVWRVRQDLKSGDVVTSADVERVVTRTAADQGDEAIPEDEWRNGWQSRRTLRAGSLVSRRDLERVPVVRAKDLVRLMMRLPGVSASAPAQAQQAGAIGESILITNLLSSKVTRARVVDAQTVEMTP